MFSTVQNIRKSQLSRKYSFLFDTGKDRTSTQKLLHAFVFSYFYLGNGGGDH